MGVDIIPTYLLCQALAVTLLLNIFLIVVIARRKRLKTPVTMPASILYISLALLDIVAALVWTLPTAISAATGSDWIATVLFGDLCKLQVWTMLFCHLMNGYILAALMFERFLKFYKPSKHNEIFFDSIVLFFVSALALFHGVIASFPIWGFGETAYFEDQYQCGVDYPFSESHFKFTLAMEYGLPFMLSLSFYVAVLIKLCLLKKRRAPNGDMIVEQDLDVPGDSYSDRLKELYARFKDAGSKSVKPKVKDKKGYNVDGYHSDEDEYYSSDEEKANTEDPKNDYPTPKVIKQKKTYYIARNDVHTTHMYFLMALLYFGLWVLYAARMFIYTYYHYDMPVSNEFTLAAVILAHHGLFVKVPFYFLSERMRKSVAKTLGCGKKEQKKSFDAPHAEKGEQTTEL